MSRTGQWMVPPGADLSDEEWRKRLSPEEYQVLRRAGTEPPWEGCFVGTKEPGNLEEVGEVTTLTVEVRPKGAEVEGARRPPAVKGEAE